MNSYYVYILSTKFNKLLYIWVTNDLTRRLYEHKNKVIDGFTKKYNIGKLIYYEECSDVKSAIEREKEIKDRRREKKLDLIKWMNPELGEIYV